MVITTHDLRIAPELLNAGLAREADTSRPLYSATGNTLRNLTCVVLRHCGLLDKVLPLLLSPRRIIREQLRGLDLNCRIRHLERETLERADGLTELFALVCIRDRLVERAARETKHLRCDTDTALVQDCNGNLVP